tara:strand:+ start:11390 stop:11572 length:183 start_codon:yes stop_codon:yes gene_type:complete
MIKENMTDNPTVDNLKKRKVEIEEELSFKFEDKPLEDELYEINDTLTKLGENDKATKHNC